MADVNDRTQNVNIWDDAKTKAVSVVTDGAIERLAVTSNITGDVTIASSTPKWQYSAASVGLTNGVDTSVFLFTGVGFVDFVQLLCKNASYETIILVDGVEELRITQADLGAIGLLSSNSTGIPLYAASASKIFSLLPNQPFHFSVSFEIKIKATSGGNSLDGWMITYREQV